MEATLSRPTRPTLVKPPESARHIQEALSKLTSFLSEQSELLEKLRSHTKRVSLLSVTCLTLLHEGHSCESNFESLHAALRDTFSCLSSNDFRFDTRYATEQFLTAQLFGHFLKQGRVLSLADLNSQFAPSFAFGDEEYLGGLFAFCQELVPYSVLRASHLDAESVKICLEVVEGLFGKFLEFDFRNGPSRRKYDGVKYVVKTLTSMYYDLSFISPAVPVKPESLRFSGADLDQIRIRMDEFDAKREDVIKRSRDAQKASKQAIYSVHRSQFKKAESQIDQAKKVLEALWIIVEKEPELRFGAFSGALEEFGEAFLFCSWLSHPEYLLPTREQIPLVNPQEYLGALSDFTGEVGRYAVICATERQEEKVHQCLSVVQLVYSVLECGGLNQKWFSQQKSVAIKTNFKKIQSLVYDLTIASRAGKRSTALSEPNLKDAEVGTEQGDAK